MPQVSLFASSIRPNLWEMFFKSLEGTSVDVEVIFSGNLEAALSYELPKNVSFKYIKTANIKPAQCYEVAARACTGELICWVADDCEFPNDVIGKAYRFYKEKCGRKDIVCIKSREHYGMTWHECGAKRHFFDNVNRWAPKMAPLGLMSREYYHALGGADRRYICGQWDNDLVMRLYNDGGLLYMFEDAYIELDHEGKHDPEFGTRGDRPFGKGYAHDRKILESAWRKNGIMIGPAPFRRFDSGFEPYNNEGITTKSQSFNMKELFND